MKVKELIELLQKQDPEREVIMSKDSEGNNFSPLSELSRNGYVPVTTWYGEIGLEPDQLTPKLKKQGYTEEDIRGDVKALVLWPVN